VSKEQYLKYSEKALNNALEKVYQKMIYEQRPTFQSYPKALVFGGQPGAGKSSIMNDMERELLDGDSLKISGDEFRKLHPNFSEIVNNFGDEWSLVTGKWSGEMVEKILDMAIKDRYNIEVEGTFKTVTAPIKTINNLKDSGYKIVIVIVTCDKNISWQSASDRYQRDLIKGELPRAVNQEYYEKLIKDLPKNTEYVYNQKLHDRFIVWNRDEHYNRNRVYDSSINGKFTKEIIEKELEPKKKIEKTAQASKGIER